MSQKFLVIGLILITVLTAGCTQIPEIKKNISSELDNEISIPENYNREAFMECVECIDGKTSDGDERPWSGTPCCPDSFESDCLAKNGVVIWQDLHPEFTVLKGCFQKAPDTGKECASGNDCMSRTCDLESAIESNKCTLIEKKPTGEKNEYGNEEFFTASYSCITSKPGKCEQTRRNGMNPA